MAASQRVRAVLDVALRVPPLFTIDAILNSAQDASAAGYLAVLCRGLVTLLGILASTVVLVLSRKALFKFYTISMALMIAATSVLVNYYTTLHMNSYSSYKLELLPSSGPSLWMPLVVLQLIFGIGFVTLLEVQSSYSHLIIVDLIVPTVGFVLEFPADVQETLVILSGLVLALYTTVCLLLRFKWFYYSTKYTVLLLKHMYQVYGLQVMIEDAWKKIHFPDVLRVFWLSRLATQAVFLVYVLKMSSASSEESYFMQWDDFWEVVCNLIISGCDSTLTVLGMSAVISSIAHYLGLGILAFIGSTEEEDKRLGFVAPVLFFILALQTGLSGLQPEERLVRLCRNMCLLLTAILHFIHGMTDPVLMSLSASHVLSFRRHFPVLLVSAFLFVLPVLLGCVLWHYYALNTWLFAVTAFCVELCLKVIVSLTVYTLFMIDGHYNVVWEKLDDYVYYVRSTGSIIEFIFGVIMFGNGAYTMMFESGSKIRACMMCLHAYFNIYLQAKNGWKTFVNRRTAVKKINSLPEVNVSETNEIDDVCAICYQEFQTSARVTRCHHYFHALCLRKWLYIQDTCPMCHQKVYTEDDPKETATFSNNNGTADQNEEPVVVMEAEEELDHREVNDEDSSDEEEEWIAHLTHSTTSDEEMEVHNTDALRD